MDPSKTYDVFLSYHWRDHAQVETVAQLLLKQNVRVFLDRWFLAPGKPWRLELEEILNRTTAVAIFVGPGEMGPWQQREITLALDRQAKDGNFPVIPVLLPHSEPVLGFLGQNTWVDLREGLDDRARLTVLADAIRGIAPGPDDVRSLEATLASICPYRGLLFFREEDAGFFFGWDLATTELSAALAKSNFVPVVGASGSGKSSVVRAGLLPTLRRDQEHTWEIITLVPGNRPLHALAAALMPLLEPSMTETDRLIEVNKQVVALENGELKLHDIVNRIIAKETGMDRVLLFIDQWEELYTLTQDNRVRSCFIDQLLEASAADEAIHVLLTIRGDFVGQAFGHRPLVDRWKTVQVSLGPMNQGELQQAINEPAKRVGLGFAPGLVERILGDVGSEPGNLPLLEFVLKQLWEMRQSGEMLHDAYEAMGQLRGAIASKAEKVFCALSSIEQQAVQRLFMQLVRPGENSEDTRQRVSLNEIGQSSRPLVWRLADQEHRLLVTGTDGSTGQETVEVSHEALIRSWSRLHEWLQADREFLLWRDRFHAARREWQNKANDDRLLLREPSLSEAESWCFKRGDELSNEDRAFVDSSARIRALQEEVEKARHERELGQARAVAETEARARKRLKWLATFLAVAVAGSLAAAYRSQVLKLAETRISKIALSRQLVAQALLSSSTKLDRALLLSLAAQRAADSGETRDVLLRNLQEAMPDRISFLSGHQEFAENVGGIAKVRSVAFSPDGKMLASASDDNTVILWDVSARKAIGEPLQGHQGPVRSVAFSPDGKMLASAHSDGAIILWNVANRKTVGEPLKRHHGLVNSVAFSGDGHLLASAGADKSIIIWDVASRTPVGAALSSEHGAVNSIACSPDGKQLASAHEDKSVILWDLTNRKPIGEPLRGHQGVAESVAFSPDGRILASGSDDQTVILWNVATRRAIAEPLRGHQAAVTSVAFGADGTTLGSSAADALVIMWDLASRLTPASSRTASPNDIGYKSFEGPVENVALSPHGKIVAAAAGQTVILWDMGNPLRIDESLKGHKGKLNSVAFSSDGKTLATGADDKTVILWDVGRRNQIGDPLQGHQGPVFKVVFSPMGQMLASESSDRIMLWDMGSPRPIGSSLPGHYQLPFGVAFSSDGKTLTSVPDGKILLWDVMSRKPLGEPRPFKSATGLSFNVLASAFSGDGKTLGLGGESHDIFLFDVGTGRQLKEPLNSHQLALMSLALSADGKMVASGGLDSTITLWDATAHKMIGEPLTGHQDLVTSVAFSPDGNMLASGSVDNRVRLWDVAARKPIGEPLEGHQGTVESLVFSADGSLLASTSEDGALILWNVNAAAWEKLACFIANRNLTHKEWNEYIGAVMAYTRLCPDLPEPRQ